MALNRDENPKIVISASGMCEGGRILHHLRHKIHNQKNTILVVGFMAGNTLGRRILDLGLAWEKEGRKGDAPLVKSVTSGKAGGLICEPLKAVIKP